ncbi:MAG: hypothetical protein PHY43_03640 [Verrucomicrobiales bacterium]|nr:hypothetical protein [Verrucomicrobiales bacterium]
MAADVSSSCGRFLMRPEITQANEAEKRQKGEGNDRDDHFINPAEPSLLGTVGRNNHVEHPVLLPQAVTDFHHA